uniref:Uncharacterized protein n=1 Tax=Micrurus lemniscatus lemniscatus TaxID=129467 RepID=A0A2D4JMP7_MICLE
MKSKLKLPSKKKSDYYFSSKTVSLKLLQVEDMWTSVPCWLGNSGSLKSTQLKATKMEKHCSKLSKLNFFSILSAQKPIILPVSPLQLFILPFLLKTKPA